MQNAKFVFFLAALLSCLGFSWGQCNYESATYWQTYDGTVTVSRQYTAPDTITHQRNGATTETLTCQSKSTGVSINEYYIVEGAGIFYCYCEFSSSSFLFYKRVAVPESTNAIDCEDLTSNESPVINIEMPLSDVGSGSCGLTQGDYSVKYQLGTGTMVECPTEDRVIVSDNSISIDTCYTGTVDYEHPLNIDLTCVVTITSAVVGGTENVLLLKAEIDGRTEFYCGTIGEEDLGYTIRLFYRSSEQLVCDMQTSNLTFIYDSDHCANQQPCQNSGTCVQATGTYSCICAPGFTGDICQTNIDECESSPCQNGGTCVDGVNSYTCTCADGYTGTVCETEINECLSSPCQNGGTCNDAVASYTCTCAAGYTGIICDINIDDCEVQPCQNGGTCFDGVNSFTCTCADGFTDSTCQTNIDDCETNQCENGGSCIDGVATFTCNCASGYTGTVCETDIDDCAVLPCLNGGTCTDLVDGFSCSCAEGFTGATCQTNIDECLHNPCLNGGSCVDEVNDYRCVCVAGYTGKECQTDIDDCADNPCAAGSTCRDLVNDFTCECPSGTMGVLCDTDVDECESLPCQNGGSCVNGMNSFTCNCAAGYTGTTCSSDIDDCINNMCDQGTCEDGVDSYTCDCDPGYMGELCDTEVNECESQPCQTGASCIDGIQKYTCVCLPGFTGETCQEEIDECLSQPCENGATCLDHFGYYSCVCPGGFNGSRCELDVDECVSMSLCKNGATCVNTYGSFNCVCTEGFIGQFCQYPDVCELQDDLCNETMTCVVNPVTGQQSCVGLCDMTPSPCLNNGTCSQVSPDSIACSCTSGFTGTNCESNVDECETLGPCENGASCVDTFGSYECDCPDSFVGQDCQFPDLCSAEIPPCPARHECVTNTTNGELMCLDQGPGFNVLALALSLGILGVLLPLIIILCCCMRCCWTRDHATLSDTDTESTISDFNLRQSPIVVPVANPVPAVTPVYLGTAQHTFPVMRRATVKPITVSQVRPPTLNLVNRVGTVPQTYGSALKLLPIEAPPSGNAAPKVEVTFQTSSAEDNAPVIVTALEPKSQ